MAGAPNRSSSGGPGTTRPGSSSAPPGSAGSVRSTADRDPRRGRGGGHQPHRHRGVVRRVRGSACSRGSPTTATRSSSPPRPATGRATRPGPSLERSLERMGVDHVDLVQLHNLVEQDEWEVAHGPGGAVEALARARDEGLTRFIGVTGHGLRIARMHRLSLEQFPFDSVLLPVNFTLLGDPTYRGRRRGAARACARGTGRGAGDQGDRPAPLERRRRRSTVQLVRAARRRGGDRPGRAVRAQPIRGCSSSRRATTASSRRPSRPPRVRSTGRPTTSSPPTSRPTGSRRSSTARPSSASE